MIKLLRKKKCRSEGGIRRISFVRGHIRQSNSWLLKPESSELYVGGIGEWFGCIWAARRLLHQLPRRLAHLSRFAVTRRHPPDSPPRSGDGTTLAAGLVTTPHQPLLLLRSTPRQPTGEGDSFLPSSQPPAPAPAPAPDRLASALPQRACSVLRRPGRPPCGVGDASGGYPARLGLGGPLLPSSYASCLRTRVVVVLCSLRCRPCAVPASFLVLREGRRRRRRRRSVHRRITYRTTILGRPWGSKPKESFEVWKFLLENA